MVLGPIPIILKKTPEGDTLGNSAENNAAAQVNEDKKAKKESARVQSPFIKEETPDNVSKNPISKNTLGEDLNLRILENTNAKFPQTKTIEDLVGVEDAGSSIKDETTTVNNKDDDGDVNPTQNVVNESIENIPPEFLEDIKSTPNKFKDFATMTYSVSLYMLGKAQYNEMVSSGTKSVKGLYLLLQSGGISNNPAGNHGAKRSENFFKNDFYIDDIEIKGMVSGTSVGSAHNSFEMNFVITESQGLTFLEQLHGIVQEYNITEGVSKDRINYASQNFLMVVRFYGYDKNGKQITARDIGISESLTDLTSVSEKFIPFQFSSIQFAIENDIIRYRCKAVAPQTQIPFGVANSTIPFNTELMGQSIKQVLSGISVNANEDTNEDKSAEDLEAQDELLETNYQISLVDALNTEQKTLVNKQVYEHANVYKIEFEKDSGIGTSSVITTADTTDLDSTNMSLTQKAQQNLLTNKGFYDPKTKRFSIQAGTSIVQAIDMLIRTSTYISDQQNIKFDEKTGKVSKKDKSPEVLQWFKIRTQVKILEYDNKRNDYAYEIKYLISRYQINNLRSPYFGPAKFRGVHKEYNYWFTGENTEVIDFRQDYNYLYYQTMGADTGVAHLQNNARELQKRYYQRNSSESNQGGKNRVAEGAANAASILYSPSDQASASLTILGDPDWIAQSELFYSPDSVGIGLGPFMHDGSVNYDSSEVLFAINYNTPVDYNVRTGLADTGTKNLGRDLASGVPGKSSISLIYRANTITTYLSNGVFRQNLQGSLMLFPTDEQKETETEEINDIIEKTLVENPPVNGMVYDYDFGEWVFTQELDENSDTGEDIGVETPTERDD